MLKFIKHLVCFIITIVLQTTLASWISFYGQQPDFVLIFIVVMALSHGPVSGMLWGFFAGFSEDVFASVDWLGAQTIAFTCVGFGVGQLEERFLRKTDTDHTICTGRKIWPVDSKTQDTVKTIC